MHSSKMEKLLGKSRQPSEPLTKRHQDIAASLQAVTEEAYFAALNHLYQQTKTSNLCVGGGVALNSLANGKIYQSTPFKRVHIFGPAGDSGASLGAALFVHRGLEKRKSKIPRHLYWGPSYKNKEVESVLKESGLSYRKISQEDKLLTTTASLLKQGKVIGWFLGKMEFGPRALGARSILARTWPKEMKDKVNLIKKREKFRPFAVSVLESEASKLFVLPGGNQRFPFMNFVFPVKKEKKPKLAAVSHQDGSCRVQTVNQDNGRYFHLLKKFADQTGVPTLLNTSFNVGNEPIIENPKQAINSFKESQIDHLIIEDYLVSKN